MSDWIPATQEMPPQGVAVLMRRRGSEQIPQWEWRTVESQARTMTDLWNAKCLLGAKIDELVKPFLKEFQLQPQDVEINCNYSGCAVKIKL